MNPIDTLHTWLPHATAIEILVTLLACTAFVWGICNYREARADYQALLDSGTDGARRLTARGAMRRDLVRLLTQVGVLVIGGGALITPSALRPEVAAYSQLVGGVLIALEVLLAASLRSELTDRKRLIVLLTPPVAAPTTWTGVAAPEEPHE